MYRASYSSCNHQEWSRKPTCYFCIHKLKWKNIQLADGCYVPVCGDCYAGIVKGRKIAEERGLYDPNRTIRGGDSMKVEKGNTGGNTLKVADVVEKKITSLKITDEGEMRTYEAEKEGDKSSTKLVIGVLYEGMTDTDPHQWSMNNKSRNALIDIWGDDTTEWVGKTVEIQLEGTGEYRHITVDSLRTK